jgi:hypothetical protein
MVIKLLGKKARVERPALAIEEKKNSGTEGEEDVG